ncbi:hypothetical protein [Streptomyces chrestomyceticus]|uniref:hypothetical protein n=1 Tax=Streptomyces chrestomyceticus TaxID=68185 RepID=UPI0033EC3CCB
MNEWEVRVLTADHFDRINTFLRARIDPLLGEARAAGNGDLVIALTSLSRAVESNYVLGTGVFNGEGPKEGREHEVGVRWDALGTMAYEWRLHPDFQRAFELSAGELGGVAPLLLDG